MSGNSDFIWKGAGIYIADASGNGERHLCNFSPTLFLIVQNAMIFNVTSIAVLL